MTQFRAWFAPLLVILSLGDRAAAQSTPPPEPAPPPLPPPPPPVYNPPAPPPYTGPSLTGTWDRPRYHDFFYLRLSLGAGTMGTSGDFDPDDGTTFETRGGCAAFDVAIGGTPVPGFVIGGDFAFQQSFRPRFKLNTPSFSTERDADVNTVFGLFGAFVDWFPDPRGGFHVGATLGYASLSVAENGNLDNSVTEGGIGGALRLGYDFWVSNDWSLGILGQFVGGRVSGDTGSVTERDTVTSFGVLFTALYH